MTKKRTVISHVKLTH